MSDMNEDFDTQEEFQGLFQQAQDEHVRLGQGIAALLGQNGDQTVAMVMREIGNLWEFLGSFVATCGTSFELVGTEEDGGSRLTLQDSEELRALLLVVHKLATELKDTSPSPEMIQKLLDGIETKLQWIDDVTVGYDDGADADDIAGEEEDEEKEQDGSDGESSPPALPSGHA